MLFPNLSEVSGIKGGGADLFQSVTSSSGPALPHLGEEFVEF